MPTVFRLVRWDKQRFLIPPDELKQFAYAVHSQSEWELVRYFAKGRYNGTPRRGLPDLPSEYRVFAKMPPINARIIDVGPGENYQKSVTIDAGSNRRVIEGMSFYYVSKGGGSQFSIRITEVDEDSSRGEVSMIGGTDDDVRITKGLRLSSRMPKNFIEPG